jgi:hypothetical protein
MQSLGEILNVFQSCDDCNFCPVTYSPAQPEGLLLRHYPLGLR